MPQHPAGRVARDPLVELALESAGVGTYEWDLVSGEITWDRRMLDLFGYDAEDFDGSFAAFTARVDAEHRPAVTEQLRRVVEECGEYDLQYRILLPDGTVRWVAARGRALGDEAGTAVRVLGVAYDITEHRRLRADTTRVLEDMPTAFFALDRQWRFTYVNAEAERVLLRGRQEMVGEVIWEVFPAALGTEFESAYREAMSGVDVASFEAFYPAPLERWYEVRAWPRADGIAVYFLDITARRRAQDAAEAAVVRSELRARVSAALSSSLEPELAVGRLARLLVPAMADWCVVTVVDDEPDSSGRHQFRDVASWHADPQLRPLVARYAQVRLGAVEDASYLARALTTAQTLVIERDATRAVSAVLRPGEARSLLEQLAPESGAVFPMRARGRTAGALTLFRGAGRPAPSAEDATQLEDLAARAALGLDNARLYRQQRHVAEGLQRTLLTDPPEPDHIEIVTRYAPAAEAAKVGGDWYDAFLQADGSTVLVIGDVVGHDVAAAATMGQLRSLLRGIAVTTGDGPARVLDRTDEALSLLQVDAIATAVVARVEQTPDDRAAGRCRVRWANAGHPDPLLVTPDGRVVPLEGERRDLLLGVRAGTERGEWTVEVPRGATLLLYTDGLVERRGRDLRAGLAALEAVVADVAAADTDLRTFCDEVLRRSRPTAGHDDVALVAVRLHSQDARRPAEAGPRDVPPGVPPDPSEP